MSKRSDRQWLSRDPDQQTLLERIQQGEADSATPEQKLLAMLYLQKLARSSTASFTKYWPRTVSIAQNLDLCTSAPSHIRGAAHGLLSFERILNLDFANAEEWALKALDEGYSLAKYCLLICRHLARKGISVNKQCLNELMAEIEECLLESTAVGRDVAQHQCYLFSLHFGLLRDQDTLIAKAKQYLQDKSAP